MNKVERFLAFHKTHEMCETIADLIRPHTYVELGVARFKTINKIMPFVQRGLAVDVTDNGLPDKHPSVDFYHMTTDEFFEKNKDLRIDFVLIDADHSYEQCLRDFFNCKDRLNESGIIAMHDTYPMNHQDHGVGECWKVVKYIQANLPEYETFTFPIRPGLTLVRKTGWPGVEES